MDFTGLTKNNSGNFITIYLNLAFYLRFCPFRLVISIAKDGRKRYIAKSNIYHKISCSVFSLSALLWLATSTWNSIPSLQNVGRPGVYFDAAFTVFNFCLISMTAKMFWFKQNNLLSILNLILNEENDLAPDQMPASKLAILFPLLAYVTIIPALGFRSGLGVMSGPNANTEWSFGLLWESLKCSSGNLYLLQNRNFSIQKCDESGIMDNILAATGIIGLLQR